MQPRKDNPFKEFCDEECKTAKASYDVNRATPKEKLKAAIDYMTYLHDKEAWEATYELASDPEIVESLKRAEADVKAGRLKSWADVKREV